MNECRENTHNCSESKNEMCLNTNGTFNCSCQSGYSRNASDALCSGMLTRHHNNTSFAWYVYQ